MLRWRYYESSAVARFAPGRLWSLWDMLEIDAYEFVGMTNQCPVIETYQVARTKKIGLANALARAGFDAWRGESRWTAPGS